MRRSALSAAVGYSLTGRREQSAVPVELIPDGHGQVLIYPCYTIKEIDFNVYEQPFDVYKYPFWITGATDERA